VKLRKEKSLKEPWFIPKNSKFSFKNLIVKIKMLRISRLKILCGKLLDLKKYFFEKPEKSFGLINNFKKSDN